MSVLYTAPFWLLVVVAVASLLTGLELGRRLARIVPVSEYHSSAIAALVLGVIGLLLGFSFSMAADRHSLRRAAAVQEANSIGTFWLRTSLLPEPTRSEMQSRLRQYVDLHLEHRRAGFHPRRTGELEAENERLQRELWALLIEDARHEPEAARLRLLMPALNAMIDDAASLQAARENRVPDPIFVYLFVLVFVAGVAVGYRPAVEKRNLLVWGMVIVVICGVLLILVDIDRPRRGWIQSGIEPHLRLQESMRVDPP